ncbi:hypothetical protein GCM10010335_62820 [Streptomyces galbus]|nr:hypothetical protein GCM10010335_62820 [Streptomyces galbus]
MPENETWDYVLSIPNDVRAVTVCRRTLRLILTLHGLIGLVDTAELLATELVSNAVRHTEGPAALRVRRTRRARCGSRRGTPTRHPPGHRDRWTKARTGTCSRRTAGDWDSSRPARTSGAGNPRPASGLAGSTSGVSSTPACRVTIRSRLLVEGLINRRVIDSNPPYTPM